VSCAPWVALTSGRQDAASPVAGRGASGPEAAAAKRLSDSPLFRFCRWLAALAVVICTWVMIGTPHDVIELLPSLGMWSF